MAAESLVASLDYDSMSSIDLITTVKKAMAALEKKEKKLVKEVAKAEEKKVKSAPVKGVMPTQLAKNSAWVKYVLEHMQQNGWESFIHPERCAGGMADVEYPESELVPYRDAKGVEQTDEEGNVLQVFAFAGSGGVMPSHGHAMSVSKLYKQTKPELYAEFEAGWEEPKAPAVSSSDKPARVVLSLAERKALKAEADAKKEVEKAERKADREAKKAATAAAAAKKVADAAAKKDAKAGKAVPAAAIVRATVPVAAAKPMARPIVKPRMSLDGIPENGATHPWTWEGVAYEVTSHGCVYEKQNSAGELGKWVGMIDLAKQIIDTSVPEPEYE